MEDGTQPFGELASTDWVVIGALPLRSSVELTDWDTPEWRAEMEAKYPID